MGRVIRILVTAAGMAVLTIQVLGGPQGPGHRHADELLIEGPPDRPEAIAEVLGEPHPLPFDRELGLFGHSDHVGRDYLFAASARAQQTPSPLVAAGLVAAAVEDDGPTTNRTVVRRNEEAEDSNGVLAMDDRGRLWLAYTHFRDGDEEIHIQRRRPGGEWGEPARLSRHDGADFDPAIGVDATGGIWVIWVRQGEGGRWPLVGRRFDGDQWSPTDVVLDGRNYAPALAALPDDGGLVLAGERWVEGQSTVVTSRLNDGEWGEPKPVGEVAGAQQRPALTAGPKGGLWLAYDVVSDRRYDVRLARWDAGRWDVRPAPPAIDGHRRRATIDVDSEGRVWVLPETEVIEPIEVRRGFNGQEVPYNVRPPARAMLVWTGDQWKALPKGPAMSAKAASLHIDTYGTVWILTRFPGPGTRDFLTVGQRYRGRQWYTGALSVGPWDGEDGSGDWFRLGDEAIGSVKEPVSVAEGDDRLLVAWHQTQREFTFQPAWTYADGPVDTLLHELELEADRRVTPELVDCDPAYHGTAAEGIKPLPHADRARPDYHAEMDGREMEVFYGDTHHHTEFSRDPGVLNDDVDGNYRYVRDIRDLDFQGLADHAEHINDHDWYRIRRAADFYNRGDRFAGMVAFEWTSEFYRNGNYQEGHHNVVYRTDGPEAQVYSASSPRSNTPAKLIERLEEAIAWARADGVPANALLVPHDPSRWVQPISWSWYDPRIRLLELVQARGNHEHLGSPQKTPLRNDFQQQLMGKSAQDGLANGFRWGFIGSGDHNGRPVVGVFSPAGDRESLFDSLYAKRTFATTGAKMVVNMGVNGHRMGSEWSGEETEHEVHFDVVGTKPVTLIELWKNGRMIWRWSPKQERRRLSMTFEDRGAPIKRENWWYLRVTQADGHMAWSSPVWYVYEAIEPRVIPDAGGPEPHYVMPGFRIPLPVLMRNQKEEPVTGRLELENLPTEWELTPSGPIEFELPPQSWETLVWYVEAPEGSIDELKALPVRLGIHFDGAASQTRPMTLIQSPELLRTRGQLSELNDAFHTQKDLDKLNLWLRTMADRWDLR